MGERGEARSSGGCEKEVRGKVSRLYVTEAQGHQVCGTRSEGGKDEVRCNVNGAQEKMRGKVIRW